MAREAMKAARDARIAERRAAKLAAEARQAAALAAAQAAEAAAREAALKAEQETRDAEFAAQTAREAALEGHCQLNPTRNEFAQFSFAPGRGGAHFGPIPRRKTRWKLLERRPSQVKLTVPLKLGIDIAQSTVAKYMSRRHGPRSPGWQAFLRNQTAHIAGVDLFVVCLPDNAQHTAFREEMAGSGTISAPLLARLGSGETEPGRLILRPAVSECPTGRISVLEREHGRFIGQSDLPARASHPIEHWIERRASDWSPSKYPAPRKRTIN